ncbi:MAG: hypothetical protein U0836_01625 [Pirellulales bacterium]
MAFRVHYSLRTLMLLIALGAAALWGAERMQRPSLRAQRFAAALNSKDFAAAETLCGDQAKFPGDWKRHVHFEPRAHVGDWTWRDYWQGRRPMYVAISYGDGQGMASCGLECIATASGIEQGMMAP